MRFPTILAVLVLSVVLLGAGCRSAQAPSPTAATPTAPIPEDVLTNDPAVQSLDATAEFSADDSTSAIRSDIDRVTLPDVDGAFTDVDKDIEGL